MTVVTSPNIAPNTYSVVVSNTYGGDSQTRTFTLVVRGPPPPPPDTTTTAPPPPTTTAPPPPPTTAPIVVTTTAPPSTTTTTAPSAPTTTFPPLRPGQGGPGFVSLTDLVEAPVPPQDLFFPILAPGADRCLPLTAPCAIDSQGLVLVAARGLEVEWRALLPNQIAPKTDITSAPALAAVGATATSAGSQNYALPVLDLTPPGRRLQTLIRHVDADGAFGPATDDLLLASPIAAGGDATTEGLSLPAAPFGAPRLVGAADVTDAEPVLAIAPDAGRQVVYVLRPDWRWRLTTDVVPLLGNGSLPHIGRSGGEVGLVVSRPDGVQISGRAVAPDEGVAAPADGGGDGGLSPALALLLVVVVGGAVTAGVVLLRRRAAN
jgi:hypothetical protein